MIRRTIVVAATVSFLGAVATSGLAQAGSKAEQASPTTSRPAALR